jgi:uncharacterized protein YukE
VVTAGQLLAADPNQIRYVAGAYRTAAVSIAARCDELDRVVRGLTSRWSGPAQAGALAALSGARSRLVDATLALTSADQALAEFAESVAVAQNGMSESVGRSLRMADAADADAARRLTASEDWFAPMVEPSYAPTVGTDPYAVSQWWKGLSSASQRYMIESRPQEVTRLDGVPVDARDEAARLLLNAERSSLEDLASTSLPPTSMRRVKAEQAGLDAISAQLDDPFASSRSYLLDVDAENDRAVISVGDPDRATDVVTMVSGVGSGLANVKPSLDAATNLADAATDRAPAFADPSAVSWLDYDAPSTMQQAMNPDRAQAATGDLARFDEGLRATHIGDRSHESLLGYSYGSTVVGLTAHTDHVCADDIVFVGSPGVGVDHAADLGLDPSHVWATVSHSDPIRLAVDPLARAEAALTGQPSDAMWFGTAPTSAAFGGQRFPSNPGTLLDPLASHMSYFDERSTSLRNIADITMGQPLRD